MTQTEQTLQTQPEKDDRRALVRRRTELEARLIAHRCGWRTLDDIRLRRVRRSLAGVLRALGAPDPAELLMQGHERQER